MMDDYIPLRVIVPCGGLNVMAATAVVRPKLFAAEAHVGIVRDASARISSGTLACFRVGKQVQSRTYEE
jgi:hypothetical protein